MEEINFEISAWIACKPVLSSRGSERVMILTINK